MKLNSKTLILLLLACGLGGFVYFYEIRGGGKGQEQQVQGSGQRIFAFEESQVQALTLITSGQRLEFVKAPTPEAKAGVSPSPGKQTEQAREKPTEKQSESKQPQSQWLLKAPEEGPANDASVAFLLSLLATGRSDRTIKAPLTQKADFGLDQPTATIELKLNDQKTHRFVLGKPDFNQSFWYAQADPATSGTPELSVLLVSPDFNNAVSRPLSEWKAAPEAPTPALSTSPSPSAENAAPSPEPAPEEASSSPESPPPADNASPSSNSSASPEPGTSSTPAPPAE
ncbi:DUF4340 domain-containing protein [Trichocoleus sp. FACHB-591]|uniref:DUF4340 domain-containing protein n=1 Tax=Trichocoleus sp. FACHB-591 TaxID=2692872 RepID=UPI0016863A3F|nr:DUF4340 domain-containing protein [Trichocoleus sp. FACHB-591]MBD2093953.1 DUF4340 domain-containing protein [Trichocoleus sp. FACHB-591]